MCKYLHSIDKIGCISFPSYCEDKIKKESKEGNIFVKYLNNLKQLKEEDIISPTANTINGEEVVLNCMQEGDYYTL